MFCLCSIMGEAQNIQNNRPNNRPMQIEVNAHLSTKDSISNVCVQEMSAHHKDVNDKTKGPNWDETSAIGSILSIVVMIVIFLVTFCQTKKQIREQHKDTLNQIAAQGKHSQAQIKSQQRNTDRHIKIQQNLTQQQISEMQHQSEARLASLEDMGNKIREFTGKIQESVEHFERTFIGKDDQKFVDTLISEIKTENQKLYLALSNDFTDLVDVFDADKSKYAEGVLKIKSNINKIQNTLDIYSPIKPLPDAQAYLDVIQKIANGPDFDIMDEQLTFYDLGETYCERISLSATNIFKNYNNNTQAS